MVKKKDRQKSGLSGELFVAAELLKREYQVSITLGTAKDIDLFAYNEDTNKSFDIQVKTLRASNCYLLKPETLTPNRVYVFVMLNKVDKAVEYFIASGQEIIDNKQTLYGNPDVDFAAIKIGEIRKYANRWNVFDET